MDPSMEGLGIGLGMALDDKLRFNDSFPPPFKASDKSDEGGAGMLGLGQPPNRLRWPYSTRYRSSTYALRGPGSSPTSSSSSSFDSDSEQSEKSGSSTSGSATHDVLHSYFSPTLSTCPTSKGEKKKVYLLSSGLRNPTVAHRRCRSETFKFPLPPSKVGAGLQPLKSALRSSVQLPLNGPSDVAVSPPVRRPSVTWRNMRMHSQLSPQFEDENEQGRQGWSPYSSVAPTPRQLSAQQRFSVDSSNTDSDVNQTAPTTMYISPPSSCSSRTLVSSEADAASESGTEMDATSSMDDAKLARLHASLFLLDSSVTELPLSLADKGAAKKSGVPAVELGGSVEEKMAYLCGLGYRSRQNSGSGTDPEEVARGAQRSERESWWSDDQQMQEEKKEGSMEKGEVREGTVKTFAPKVVGAYKAVRVVSDSASAVTSSCSSPILGGVLAAHPPADLGQDKEMDEGEGDETVRPQNFFPESHFEDLLGGEFSYLVHEELGSMWEKEEGARSAPDSGMSTSEHSDGLMTPPLTTPELGLNGASPLLLEAWPTPPHPGKRFHTSSSARNVTGCRPFSTSSSIDPFKLDTTSAISSPLRPGTMQGMRSSVSSSTSLQKVASTSGISPEAEEDDDDAGMAAEIACASRTTISHCSVLTRPRPLRASESCNSLFSSASADGLQKPNAAVSMLSRPRPIPSRSWCDSHSFLNEVTLLPKPKTPSRPGGMVKSASTTTSILDARQRALGVLSARGLGGPGIQVKVPQRKSSLDVRAEADLHRKTEAETVVHPNSINRDPELAQRFHSSASPYLSHSHSQSYQPSRQNVGGLCSSAATAAKIRRKKSTADAKAQAKADERMPKSFSLPVLFTARTPAQRAAGASGMPNRIRCESAVFVGPADDEYRPVPPKQGVLVVEQHVTTIGLAL